ICHCAVLERAALAAARLAYSNCWEPVIGVRKHRGLRQPFAGPVAILAEIGRRQQGSNFDLCITSRTTADLCAGGRHILRLFLVAAGSRCPWGEDRHGGRRSSARAHCAKRFGLRRPRASTGHGVDR
ncbi:unnamed protein product, partial [Symbiodinium sp. KB8]